jgi:starch phosphorylase
VGRSAIRLDAWAEDIPGKIPGTLAPYEASGTSGMKAALNGVPSFSILDGWWIEGCVEGATGWAIGHDEDMEDPTIEIASMYDKLERIVLPLYYRQPAAFAEVMRSAICLNGSFFNTQRMLSQYMSNAYYPEKTTSVAAQMSTLAGQEVRKVS